MKKIVLLSIFSLSLLFISCSGDQHEYGIYWGKQVSFKNFLWSTYTPDTIKQTLRFDMEGVEEPIVLGLYDTYTQEDGGEILSPVTDSAVELYINGNRCSNHKFKVTPQDKSIELGVVFTSDAEKKDYYWVLQVENAGDADMINDNLTSKKIPLLFTWKADYTSKMNPLALGVLLVSLAILACLIVWICFLRFIFIDRFGVKYIVIEDKESERMVKLRGALSLTLTNKVQKQSVWERIFKGKRLYFRDDFFNEGDIVVMPRNRKTVRLNAPDVYKMEQYTISKEDNAPLVIRNSEKQQKELHIV